MCDGSRRNRGQSPVIGNILTVAIVVILASVIGVAVLGFSESLNDSPPAASIETEIGTGDITLLHKAGKSLDPTNVEIVVVGPNATVRYPMENFKGDPTSAFTAGTTFSLPHGVSSGKVDVRVVHEPTESIISRGQRRIVDGIISLAAFDDKVPTNDYTGGQNNYPDASSTTVTDGGRTVKLTGSQWKYLVYSYDVTPETVLTFEFKSTAEGDIHGIGLEDDYDSGQDENRIVRLYGTQNWGISVSKETTEPYYQQSDGWRRYTIPLGELYETNNRLGQADSLVFVMDCDPSDDVASGTDDDRCKSQNADGDPTATSFFRNVELYDAD
ncbi:type IV pilin [Halovenus halobia]|uniref:type IV pilin n=1 Tax=Halovenus halobia TaxID=3396622 RepID=UPI003F57D0A6